MTKKWWGIWLFLVLTAIFNFNWKVIKSLFKVRALVKQRELK